MKSRNTIRWLLIAVSTAAAPTGRPALAADPEPGIASVIEKLQVERDEFQELVSAKLSPGQQQLRESFQGTVKELEQKLLQIHGDPQNAKLKAEYEETLSNALAQGVHLLQEFSSLKGPAEKQLADLSKALAQTRDACEAEIAGSRERAEEYQTTATQLESKLTAMAQQYQEVLAKADGNLPDDLDFDIQILQVDLEIARRNAQFCELAQADFAAALEDLNTQTGELRDLKGALQLMFRQSDGQTLLLKNVATIKERRLAAARITGNLAKMRQMIGDTRTQFANVQSLVDRLIKHDLQIQRPQPGTSSVVAKRSPQAGADILRSYLKTNSTSTTEVSRAK